MTRHRVFNAARVAILIPLALFLIFFTNFSQNAVEAQNAPTAAATYPTVTLVIYRDTSYFILYVPQAISLSGLQFTSIIGGVIKTQTWETDFSPGNPVAVAQGCYEYYLDGTANPLPSICTSRNNVNKFPLLKGDVFWYDNVGNRPMTVVILGQDIPPEQASCGSASSICSFTWQDIPTPTPPTLPPMPPTDTPTTTPTSTPVRPTDTPTTPPTLPQPIDPAVWLPIGSDFIQRFLVTYHEFGLFVAGLGNDYEKLTGIGAPVLTINNTNPYDNATWGEANAYCRDWLPKQPGYEGYSFSLPTQAQWDAGYGYVQSGSFQTFSEVNSYDFYEWLDPGTSGTPEPGMSLYPAVSVSPQTAQASPTELAPQPEMTNAGFRCVASIKQS